MTEQDPEATDLPLVISERIVPPTEVEWSVEKRTEDIVELELSTGSRIVFDQILLSPETAEHVADRLEAVAKDLQTD